MLRYLTLCVLFVFTRGAQAIRVSDVVIVTPVYRELFNGNLFRHLAAFAEQAKSKNSPTVRFVFVVNHTQATDAAIKAENEMTLKLLMELAVGHEPEFCKQSTHCHFAATAILGSGIKIEVLNRLNFYASKPVIGELRDMGVQHAFGLFPDHQLNEVVIGMMDADTLPDPNYTSTVERVFSDDKVDFALTDTAQTLDSASDPEISRRAIEGDLQLAASSWHYLANDKLPETSTPRILVRANILKKLGGVPKIAYAEDPALISALKESSRGVFLPELVNKHQYRGRPDGYDAAENFKAQKRSVKIPDSARSALDEIDFFRYTVLPYYPEFFRGFNQVQDRKLEEHKQQVTSRRQKLAAMIADPTTKITFTDDPFLQNAWLPGLIQETLNKNKGDVMQSLAEISLSFPELLEPLSKNRLSSVFIEISAANEVMKQWMRSVKEPGLGLLRYEVTPNLAERLRETLYLILFSNEPERPLKDSTKFGLFRRLIRDYEISSLENEIRDALLISSMTPNISPGRLNEIYRRFEDRLYAFEAKDQKMHSLKMRYIHNSWRRFLIHHKTIESHEYKRRKKARGRSCPAELEM